LSHDFTLSLIGPFALNLLCEEFSFLFLIGLRDDLTSPPTPAGEVFIYLFDRKLWPGFFPISF